MKIVLVQPPIRDMYRTRFREYPLGLLYLAASLKRAGDEVLLLDARKCRRPKRVRPYPEISHIEKMYEGMDLFSGFFHFGMSYEDIGRRVKEFSPDVVCIGASFTPYEREVLATANAVKMALPECRVVAGGVHASADPASLLVGRVIPAKATVVNVDWSLRGAVGDAAIPRRSHGGLLRYARNDPISTLTRASKAGIQKNIIDTVVCGEPDEHLHEILSSGAKGVIRDGDRPYILKDIENAPFPARKIISADEYMLGRRRYAMVITSRGCPHRCSFCSVHTVAGHGFRARSVTSVLEEIDECVEKYGVSAIDIQDDNFLFDRERALNILEGIVKTYHGKDIEFLATNGLNAAHMDEDILRLMRSAGFKKLDIALGTGDVSSRTSLSRPESVEKFETVLDAALRAGLKVTTYIILGIPTQPLEEMKKTVKYLMKKKTLISPSIFYNVPGMPIYNDMKRYEYVGENVARRGTAVNCFGEDFEREDIIELFAEIRMYNNTVRA